jgi:predicted acetyltransferase
VRAVRHTGYGVEEPHYRRGYAARALELIGGLARHYHGVLLWVLIELENTTSHHTSERAGLRLADIVEAAPEAVGLGHGVRPAATWRP